MVRLYEWAGQTNWGDRLSPYLLEHYAGVETTWSPAAKADLICTGSVVGHVPDSWSGHILGSGKLFEYDKIPPDAHIWALRGKLSARGVRGTYALGDPGLLADELVPAPVKRHKLGILPHWSDRELTKRTEWDKYAPLRINPTWEPLSVISAIGSCDKLVTSSLHGLIVADAFGIPRRFEAAKQLAREGGFFKHKDYSSSIGAAFEVGVTMNVSRFKVNDCRDALIDAFENYGTYVRSIGA